VGITRGEAVVKIVVDNSAIYLEVGSDRDVSELAVNYNEYISIAKCLILMHTRRLGILAARLRLGSVLSEDA
jgi:hypothetical protein